MPYDEPDVQGRPARHRGRYRDRPEEALSPSGSGYSDDGPDHAPPDYAGPATGYPARGGHRDESAYPRAAAPYQHEDSFRGQPGAAASREGSGQPSAWPSGYQQGWPQEYPQEAPRGHRRRGSDRDELAGRPPAGEVHHEGPGRRDRAARSWPEPEEDEGDTW
jgi:hypothetical protein